MAYGTQKYSYNQTFLKLYGYGKHKKIKLIQMKCVRTAGLECDEDKILNNSRCLVNAVKLDENIIRARNKIFELAFCNPWDWFFTGTLDRKKYDRTDLNKYHKDLTQFFRDQGKKFGCKIHFLLIPELHSDGKSWHIHGFIQGLPLRELKQFVIGDKMGKALADKVKKGDKVYNWLAYAKKFGFCDLERVHNPEAISKYITKYINKNLATSVTQLNAHMYYHSRGLKTAELIKKGTMSANIVPDFENEYCRVLWCEYSDDLLCLLSSQIL